MFIQVIVIVDGFDDEIVLKADRNAQVKPQKLRNAFVNYANWTDQRFHCNVCDWDR